MGSHNGFFSDLQPQLNMVMVRQLVRHALVEDIGRGDITTNLTIPKDKSASAVIVTKEECIVCGLAVAEAVFKTVDSALLFKPLAKEGRQAKAGKKIAEISGCASGILTAERVALNLFSMMSAIATKTREYVRHIEPYKTKISDTRKTFPGLRELQKYAVRIGGGYNHRMGLDEMILIKDNHLQVTGGYEKLPSVPKGFKIEIEVGNLVEFKHALRFKPDFIMLDNMSADDIREAVKIRDNTLFTSHHPRTKLEASGGVDLAKVKEIAASGVDIISIGELTHSVKSIDMSLEIL